jgi:hypothetical protein
MKNVQRSWLGLLLVSLWCTTACAQLQSGTGSMANGPALSLSRILQTIPYALFPRQSMTRGFVGP